MLDLPKLLSDFFYNSVLEPLAHGQPSTSYKNTVLNSLICTVISRCDEYNKSDIVEKLRGLYESISNAEKNVNVQDQIDNSDVKRKRDLLLTQCCSNTTDNCVYTTSHANRNCFVHPPMEIKNNQHHIYVFTDNGKLCVPFQLGCLFNLLPWEQIENMDDKKQDRELILIPGKVTVFSDTTIFNYQKLYIVIPVAGNNQCAVDTHGILNGITDSLVKNIFDYFLHVGSDYLPSLANWIMPGDGVWNDDFKMLSDKFKNSSHHHIFSITGINKGHKNNNNNYLENWDNWLPTLVTYNEKVASR